jgi:hypothetical protein
MNVYIVHEIISENSIELSRKPVNNSVNSAEFWVSKILWFLVWLNFVSAEFSLFSPIF